MIRSDSASSDRYLAQNRYSSVRNQTTSMVSGANVLMRMYDCNNPMQGVVHLGQLHDSRLRGSVLLELSGAERLGPGTHSQ